MILKPPIQDPERSRAPGQRTRILIVDRDPSAVTALRHLFTGQDWEVLVAKSGQDALQKARVEGPDAVVAEMHLPDMAAPDLCRALAQRPDTAGVPVIVLSASSGVAERVACLRAGAADYLVKPPEPQELLARLRAALDLRHERSAFVVAVCSGKGGVGTSTIAANVAVALRRQTRGSVVLLDASAHMGAADVLLNLQPRPGIEHLLAQVDELEAGDFEAILTAHTSGLQALLLQEQELGPIEADALRKVLLALRRTRDYLVLDLPSSLDDRAAVALELADRALLVLTPEITALRGAKLFLEWAARQGLPYERIMPVLNRYPQRGGLERKVVESALGLKVAAGVADEARLITYSINRGIAVVESHPRSKPARALSALVQQMVRPA